MSRSPRDETDPDQIFQYRKAWAAINTMLERGRSLSGHERHCAFLNTAGPRFADVSAASDLDLLDDGRGVALVDWDHDGRVDLWTTNRTAPWVRLLQNQSTTNNHFLSVELQGVSCNRDAIGARLELHLGGDTPRTLTKSLRAGEGFVAQSSKRILFGLGSETNIEKLVVRWPGGDPQIMEHLHADTHYRIVQDDAQPQVWTPPQSNSFPAARPLPPPELGERIILAGRVPLPELKYQQFNGETVSLQAGNQRPMLVNLWASWCAPCIGELNQWQASWPELSKQVEIVALNVDGLDPTAKADAAQIEPLVQQRKWPFTVGLGTKDTVEVLEIVVNALIDKPQSLAVPMSVLIDKQGRVAAIYRGPVDAEQLLQDVNRLDGTAEQRRDRAAHFAGRWFDEPPPSDPAVLLRNFVVAGRLDAAENYLQRWLRTASEGERPTVEAYYAVAEAHRAAGQLDAAASLYQQALAVEPDQPRVNLDLAICLLKLGKLDEARGHLETSLAGDPHNADTRKRLVLVLARLGRFPQMQQQAQELLRTDPQDTIARLHLAHALKKQQQYTDALAQYQMAVEQQPNLLLARNDLAWLLATCADDDVRDGEAAIASAEFACRATNFAQPALLDTLAAAQAEVGRFEEAIATLETAAKLTSGAGDERLQAIIQQHLDLYRKHVPLREE